MRSRKPDFMVVLSVLVALGVIATTTVAKAQAAEWSETTETAGGAPLAWQEPGAQLVEPNQLAELFIGRFVDGLNEQRSGWKLSPLTVQVGFSVEGEDVKFRLGGAAAPAGYRTLDEHHFHHGFIGFRTSW